MIDSIFAKISLIYFLLNSGFINFIVEPSLAVMGDMIDKLLEQLLAEGESTKSNDSKEK